jgi:hypothetical protein
MLPMDSFSTCHITSERKPPATIDLVAGIGLHSSHRRKLERRSFLERQAAVAVNITSQVQVPVHAMHLRARTGRSVLGLIPPKREPAEEAPAEQELGGRQPDGRAVLLHPPGIQDHRLAPPPHRLGHHRPPHALEGSKL